MCETTGYPPLEVWRTGIDRGDNEPVHVSGAVRAARKCMRPIHMRVSVGAARDGA